ncbi:MAG: helix-turn-helix domain-containing protein [Candidatus Acidiferrales bacterium]
MENAILMAPAGFKLYGRVDSTRYGPTAVMPRGLCFWGELERLAKIGVGNYLVVVALQRGFAMTAQRVGAAETRPLDILGISEVEESAYRWLLAHSGATVPEIAQALALTIGKTQRLLDAIGVKGLVTHTPERPRRYIPVSPDISMEALILQHQNYLQRARRTVQELRDQAAEAEQSDKAEHMVELITSREVETQIYHQIHRMCQHEIIALMRPPVLISRFDIPPEEDQLHQREAHARGVRYRSITDPDWLSLPGAVQRTQEDIKSGEDVRILSNLPFKMLISDQRIALIPLSPSQPTSPTLLVRSSALLDALCTLFELFWERATPISFTRAGALERSEPDTQLSAGTEDLLLLMAAGLNDKKIAYELGLSLRTLYRRIAELMKSLDARTRFQFGWLAALRLSGVKNKVDPTRK